MGPLKKDIKLVRSLHQKKFRNETGLFLVEGKKMVEEAMNSSFRIHSIYSTDVAFLAKYPDAMSVNSREMEQMSALNSPSDYLAVLEQPKKDWSVEEGRTMLVLDGIADPGNLGTIIRTAEWFGIRDILCTPDTVELYNPKVVQSTMGSIFRTRVAYAAADSIASRMKEKGLRLIGAVLGGESVFSSEISENTALVIGSESHGIRPDFLALLDERITIPGAGGAESLNASVAAGILMAELFRRRH